MTTTIIKKTLAELGAATTPSMITWFREMTLNQIHRLSERCFMQGVQSAIKDEAWAKKLIAAGPGKERDDMLRKRFDADQELEKPNTFCSPYQKATP